MITRTNNFDLLRAFAALQVFYFHAQEHLRLGAGQTGWFDSALSHFPGVPIFFVISGFLITDAYLRNQAALTAYLRNRALRIFPALIVCTVFTVMLLGYFGYLTLNWRLLAWFVGQITVLPIYNPVFLRGFGVGDPNGALWTIPVEMQFYLFVPMFFGLLAWIGWTGRKQHALCLGGCLAVSFGIYCWYTAADHTPLWMQVFYISLAPHLWMFLLGALAQIGWRTLQPYLAGKALYWLVGYGLFCALITVMPLGWAGVFLQKVLLAGVVLACAFSLPDLAHKLLKRTDISYGMYLYHMPVINALVEFDKTGQWTMFPVALGITICLAGLSWFMVERPALSLKRGKTAFAQVHALG